MWPLTEHCRGVVTLGCRLTTRSMERAGVQSFRSFQLLFVIFRHFWQFSAPFALVGMEVMPPAAGFRLLGDS